jgi:hypothetical protein
MGIEDAKILGCCRLEDFGLDGGTEEWVPASDGWFLGATRTRHRRNLGTLSPR